MPAVHEAFVDALFYLAAALRAHVVDHLAGVGTADDVGRTPKLLIAPHVYGLLGRRRELIVRRVALLGPAHRVALGGGLTARAPVGVLRLVIDLPVLR